MEREELDKKLLEKKNLSPKEKGLPISQVSKPSEKAKTDVKKYVEYVELEK